jgi:hypothetical protein
MRKVFDNEKRFGSNLDQFITINNTGNESREKQLSFPENHGFKDSFIALYNMQEYTLKNPEFLVEINSGSYELSDRNLFHLMYDEYVHKETYNTNVKNIVSFFLTPIPQYK